MSNCTSLHIRTKLALVGIAAAFFTIQVRETILRRSLWPFCSYNMFSSSSLDRFDRMKIVLVTNSGRRYEVEPGNAIQVEFFRAPRWLREGLVLQRDPAKRRKMVDFILRELNEEGWIGRDETLPSAKAIEGELFVSLNVLRVQFRKRAEGNAARFEVNEVVKLYDSETDRFFVR